ncbi:MAG: DNA adenine methylase [Chloroflexi bacterium]|nr:DNA adenine methylase [Chloroflexota bacterium]MCI0577291.1 DNA adenine methylase [Chloroflexota bacterium]MCI0647735.1 DNA adenine methylase [Chloroflexota bacterium]MCI0731599.1 DNA adenine methylase [Chloroflexota bacterium]
MTRALVAGAAPFLKWAGGKSQLLKQYQEYFPGRGQIGRYFEPFIGSAAVFFHLQPAQARLSDVNGHLVEAYQVVQKDVDGLIEALRVHQNDKEYYYQVRAQDPAAMEPVERVARLIFLNKTCYNGLYRENGQGKFNVPFGRYKNPTICDEERLRTASKALQGVEICQADFARAVEEAAAGDFIYFDPPYSPLSPTSSFTSYHQYGFSSEEQQRLAETFHCLAQRGCIVMLSNSSTSLVRQLYEGHSYQLIEIQARRSINSKADGRGPVTELLILSQSPPGLREGVAGIY